MRHVTLGVAALAAALASHSAAAQSFSWVRRMGGAGTDSTWSVSVDGLGNAYVAGMFQNTATFGGLCQPLTSAGYFDAFFAMYAPNGLCLWARRLGGAGYDAAYGIRVDGGGRLYATGIFSTPATMGSNTLTGVQQDVFVVRLNPLTGTAMWVRTGGGAGLDMGRAVAIDGAGNAYVTGYVDGPSTWIPQPPLASAGQTDVFVARYAPNGTLQWVRGAGGPLNDEGRGIAVTAAGDVYVTGLYMTSATFGGPSVSSTGQYGAFLARYTGAGAAVWAVNAGAPGAFWGNSVSAIPGPGAVDVYVAGRQGLYPDAIFLGRYSATGAAQWVRVTTAPAELYGVVANAAGGTLLAGTAWGAVSFAGAPLTATLPFPAGAGFDGFVVQYDAAGFPVWVRRMAGGGNDVGLAVAMGPGRTGWASGAFAATATWPTLAPVASAGGQDGFVTRLSCLPPPTGLAGWWTADGKATDESANGNNGTLSGGAAYGPGAVNQGLLLPGGASVLQVPSSATLNVGPAGSLGAGNFSVDFWIRATAGPNPGVRTVLDKRTQNPLRGYHVAIFNGVPLLQLADGAGTNYFSGFPGVADGGWHFVAVTVNRQSPTGIVWYLDGQPAGVVSNPTGHPGTLANSAPLLIGNHQFALNAELVGSLDEVEIFNRVLTPAEVAAIYNAPYGKCRSP